MDFFRHIYWEWNVLADSAAKNALDRKADFHTEFPAMVKATTSSPRYLRVYTDGSHRDGIAGAGWVILGAWDVSDFECSEDFKYDQSLVMPVWEPLLTAGRFLGSSTIVNAELAAIELAMQAVQKIGRN